MSDVKMAQYWQESPVDDEQSLALAVKRDSAAFGELYQRYVKRIYAYLYTNLGNQAEIVIYT
jgi:DNA-directed RNA polymerase specialized sigma24 family protein